MPPHIMMYFQLLVSPPQYSLGAAQHSGTIHTPVNLKLLCQISICFSNEAKL